MGGSVLWIPTLSGVCVCLCICVYVYVCLCVVCVVVVGSMLIHLFPHRTCKDKTY